MKYEALNGLITITTPDKEDPAEILTDAKTVIQCCTIIGEQINAISALCAKHGRDALLAVMKEDEARLVVSALDEDDAPEVKAERFPARAVVSAEPLEV